MDDERDTTTSDPANKVSPYIGETYETNVLVFDQKLIRNSSRNSINFDNSIPNRNISGSTFPNITKSFINKTKKLNSPNNNLSSRSKRIEESNKSDLILMENLIVMKQIQESFRLNTNKSSPNTEAPSTMQSQWNRADIVAMIQNQQLNEKRIRDFLMKIQDSPEENRKKIRERIEHGKKT